MDRRKFIASTVAAGSVGLAGCSSILGPDPANLQEPTLSAPDTTPYGEPITLSVSVENTGGKEGTFEATLTADNDAVDFTTDISLTVPSGETKTYETDEITLPAAADYTFTLESTSSGTSTESTTTSDPTLATTTVTVETATKDANSTITLDNGLTFTPTSVEVLNSVFTGQDEPTGVFTAPSNKMLALYHIEVENTGTESATWSPDMVGSDGGGIYGDTAPAIPNTGVNFATRQSLAPSETATGYILAQFPTSVATTETPLTVQTDGGNTTPEYRWGFESPAERTFGDLALDSIDAPEQVQNKEPYEIKFTVTNTGDGDATFKGVLQYQDGNDWTKLSTADQSIINKTVPAGETTTITVTNTAASGYGSTTYTYRLIPFPDRTWETTVE